MVFSSIPPYLDPSNWQQANTSQPVGGGGGGSSSSHFSVPTPPVAVGVPPTPGYNGAGSIRPGSMAEQARIANIPIPETALKCPRCDSTNTKFCYYNNYNLNQPRYLCKACKRYWTKGGTRRNVPVGGGSRRNKRSSAKSSSKSLVDSSGPSGGSGGGSGGGALLGLLSPQVHHPLRFMAPSSLSQLGHHEFIHGDTGLQYNIGISNHFNLGVEPWRFQTSNSLTGLRHGMTSTTPWGRETHQSSSVTGLETFPLIQGNDKLKESDDQELNLSRQILVIHGNDQNNHQFNPSWESVNGGSTTSSWTDLSGFTSSSTTTTTNPPL